jgi:hypothetical protein
MSTKSTTNLKPIELTPSELDSVAGGQSPQEAQQQLNRNTMQLNYYMALLQQLGGSPSKRGPR